MKGLFASFFILAGNDSVGWNGDHESGLPADGVGSVDFGNVFEEPVDWRSMDAGETLDRDTAKPSSDASIIAPVTAPRLNSTRATIAPSAATRTRFEVLREFTSCSLFYCMACVGVS